MSGRRIDDYSFWAGFAEQGGVFPKGVHNKIETSAESAGMLNRYEDTTETIKAQQVEGVRKAKAHSTKPNYRN